MSRRKTVYLLIFYRRVENVDRDSANATVHHSPFDCDFDHPNGNISDAQFENRSGKNAFVDSGRHSTHCGSGIRLGRIVINVVSQLSKAPHYRL